MSLDFSLWLEFFSGVILLFISTWAFLSFKLKTFKNASFFTLAGNDLLSKVFISIAVFLLSISFAMLICSAKDIGLGR